MTSTIRTSLLLALAVLVIPTVTSASPRASSVSEFKGDYIGICVTGSSAGGFRIAADGAGEFSLSAHFTVPSTGAFSNTNTTGTYQVEDGVLAGGDAGGNNFSFRGYLDPRGSSATVFIRFLAIQFLCFTTLTAQ